MTFIAFLPRFTHPTKSTRLAAMCKSEGAMSGKVSPEGAQRFAATWMKWYEKSGTVANVAGELGAEVRPTFRKRRRVEEALGIRLPGLGGTEPVKYVPQQTLDIEVSGTVVVASDLHHWPDHEPFAWFMLLEAVKAYKPVEVWLNGDIFDWPQLRFERRGWEDRPTAAEEMEAARDRTQSLTEACDKINAVKRLTMGNHDERFDRYLSRKASELEGIEGMSFDSQIYHWEQGWQIYHSLRVNQHCVVKHSWHGGIHSAYNNVVRSGVSMVTGHTHKLLARHWSDYKGVRWAIETGFIGECHGPQFNYADGNPADWVPGFAVLHFDGEHLDHELIECHGTQARMNGKWWYREDYPCSRQSSA